MDFTTWWSRLQTTGNGGKKNNSRCTDRTDWYIATLQCSSGGRPYSNNATEGRASVISVDFFEFSESPWQSQPPRPQGVKLTSQISLERNTKLARHMSQWSGWKLTRQINSYFLCNVTILHSGTLIFWLLYPGYFFEDILNGFLVGRSIRRQE